MDKSERDVFRLLGEIYGAGLGEKSWVDTLGALATFFEAPCCVAFDVDRETGAVPLIYGFGSQPGQGEYVDRMNAIDPRKKRALAKPGCFTTYDYEVVSEAEIRRSEFYDWMERDGGIKYHIGSRIIDAKSVSSFVSVNFDARRGHADADEIEMLRLLAPHIANAWRMSQRLVQASCIDDFNLMLLESTPWGVITLDRCGRVLSVNANARQAIGRADGLRIEKGNLRALRAADDRSLQVQIGRALRTARGESFDAGGTLAIGRSGAIAPYGLRVLPMRQVIGRPPDQIPFVAIFIADPAAPVDANREDLTTIFGFTRREADVALDIAQGLSVAEIAAHLELSPSTVRSHLASAMAKTGASSHGRLATLVRGLPAGDEPL